MQIIIPVYMIVCTTTEEVPGDFNTRIETSAPDLQSWNWVGLLWHQWLQRIMLLLERWWSAMRIPHRPQPMAWALGVATQTWAIWKAVATTWASSSLLYRSVGPWFWLRFDSHSFTLYVIWFEADRTGYSCCCCCGTVSFSVCEQGLGSWNMQTRCMAVLTCGL